MQGLSATELLLILATGVLALLPFWIIIRRTGLPGPLSLCLLVPVLNLIILYYVAFARWPAVEARKRFTPPNEPIHPT
ncbi:MAG: hypothetical protein LLG06_03350 [Desulfobacteraceae bacterium]|nr:hypothetical protein [Desulfobacteraceae bacterium]